MTYIVSGGALNSTHSLGHVKNVYDDDDDDAGDKDMSAFDVSPFHIVVLLWQNKNSRNCGFFLVHTFRILLMFFCVQTTRTFRTVVPTWWLAVRLWDASEFCIRMS